MKTSSLSSLRLFLSKKMFSQSSLMGKMFLIFILGWISGSLGVWVTYGYETANGSLSNTIVQIRGIVNTNCRNNTGCLREVKTGLLQAAQVLTAASNDIIIPGSVTPTPPPVIIQNPPVINTTPVVTTEGAHRCIGYGGKYYKVQYYLQTNPQTSPRLEQDATGSIAGIPNQIASFQGYVGPVPQSARWAQPVGYPAIPVSYSDVGCTSIVVACTGKTVTDFSSPTIVKSAGYDGKDNCGKPATATFDPSATTVGEILRVSGCQSQSKLTLYTKELAIKPNEIWNLKFQADLTATYRERRSNAGKCYISGWGIGQYQGGGMNRLIGIDYVPYSGSDNPGSSPLFIYNQSEQGNWSDILKISSSFYREVTTTWNRVLEPAWPGKNPWKYSVNLCCYGRLENSDISWAPVCAPFTLHVLPENCQ